jgi:hypothetical protein
MLPSPNGLPCPAVVVEVAYLAADPGVTLPDIIRWAEWPSRSLEQSWQPRMESRHYGVL